MHFARTQKLTVVASFAWLLVGVTSTYKRMVWFWCYETPWKMLLIVATLFCCHHMHYAWTYYTSAFVLHCTTGYYLAGLRRRGSLILGIGVIQFLSKMVVHTFCFALSCGCILELQNPLYNWSLSALPKKMFQDFQFCGCYILSVKKGGACILLYTWAVHTVHTGASLASAEVWRVSLFWPIGDQQYNLHEPLRPITNPEICPLQTDRYTLELFRLDAI